MKNSDLASSYLLSLTSSIVIALSILCGCTRNSVEPVSSIPTFDQSFYKDFHTLSISMYMRGGKYLSVEVIPESSLFSLRPDSKYSLRMSYRVMPANGAAGDTLKYSVNEHGNFTVYNVQKYGDPGNTKWDGSLDLTTPLEGKRTLSFNLTTTTLWVNWYPLPDSAGAWLIWV